MRESDLSSAFHGWVKCTTIAATSRSGGERGTRGGTDEGRWLPLEATVAEDADRAGREVDLRLRLDDELRARAADHVEQPLALLVRGLARMDRELRVDDGDLRGGIRPSGRHVLARACSSRKRTASGDSLPTSGGLVLLRTRLYVP